MQGIGRVLPVKDDLVAGETPSACDRQQPEHLFVRDAVHEPPAHT